MWLRLDVLGLTVLAGVLRLKWRRLMMVVLSWRATRRCAAGLRDWSSRRPRPLKAAGSWVVSAQRHCSLAASRPAYSVLRIAAPLPTTSFKLRFPAHLQISGRQRLNMERKGLIDCAGP